MEPYMDGSRFMKRSGGGFGSLNYYAVDDDAISDSDILSWLVECGAWRPMIDTGDPATDMNAALELAEQQQLFDDGSTCLYKRKRDGAWCVGWPDYGRLDPLSIADTPARAICLYLLRYPEIDRLVNDKRLPYAGWATRYEKDVAA